MWSQRNGLFGLVMLVQPNGLFGLVMLVRPNGLFGLFGFVQPKGLFGSLIDRGINSLLFVFATNKASILVPVNRRITCV